MIVVIRETQSYNKPLVYKALPYMGSDSALFGQ